MDGLHRRPRVSDSRKFTSENDLFYRPTFSIDPAGHSSAFHHQLFGLEERRRSNLFVFEDGAVIWRIWPAILFYTVLAAAVSVVTNVTNYDLGIASTMLTVIGLVVGFALSYRTSSAYACFWEGRCCWTNIMNHSRNLARLIWLHVRVIDPHHPSTHIDAESEAVKGLVEKLTMINLITGYSAAVKHHLRAELGPFYEDTWPYVGALPKYASAAARTHTAPPVHVQEPQPQSASQPSLPAPKKKTLLNRSSAISLQTRTSSTPDPSHAPLLPSSPTSPTHSHPSNSNGHAILRHLHPSFPPLLPAALPPARHHTLWDVLTIRKPKVDRPPSNDMSRDEAEVQESAEDFRRRRGRHHRPTVAGGGENLPLELLLYLSTYVGEVEERGTATGPIIGQMYSCITALGDQLAALERILTTPLPYAYACHLRHTVWLYLLLLPIQLIPTLNWVAIPCVAIASFFFLGFLAISEEIENPFQYEANDLTLDLFCRVLQHDLREITSHASLHRDISDLLTPKPKTDSGPSLNIFKSSDDDASAKAAAAQSTKSYYASHAHTRWVFSNSNYPLYPLDKRSAMELVSGARSTDEEGNGSEIAGRGGRVGMKASLLELDAILARGPGAWVSDMMAGQAQEV